MLSHSFILIYSFTMEWEQAGWLVGWMDGWMAATRCNEIVRHSYNLHVHKCTVIDTYIAKKSKLSLSVFDSIRHIHINHLNNTSLGDLHVDKFWTLIQRFADFFFFFARIMWTPHTLYTLTLTHTHKGRTTIIWHISTIHNRWPAASQLWWVDFVRRKWTYNWSTFSIYNLLTSVYENWFSFFFFPLWCRTSTINVCQRENHCSIESNVRNVNSMHQVNQKKKNISKMNEQKCQNWSLDMYVCMYVYGVQSMFMDVYGVKMNHAGNKVWSCSCLCVWKREMAIIIDRLSELQNMAKSNWMERHLFQ